MVGGAYAWGILGDEPAPDSFESDNTPAQAKPIAVDGTMQHRTIAPAGDADWVAFQAVAGKSYVIETFAGDHPDTDTILELYDAAVLGSYEVPPIGAKVPPLAASDDKDFPKGDYFSRITWTASANKTMYVKVSEIDPEYTGDYLISITETAAFGKQTIRVEGTDRYRTAIAASQATFPEGSLTAVLATGENFADSLGGAALAGALDGPMLLTRKSQLPPEVLTELKRLAVGRVYILGSDAAISVAVENALKAALGSGSVMRIGGATRYETALMVAEEAIAHKGASYGGKVFVATGVNFPDALGASPLSARLGIPVILANPNASTVALPDKAADAIILGSTTVVSTAMENSLKAKLGASRVSRVAGIDRYETASKVAHLGVGEFGMRKQGVGIATGANFPDALGAGPALSRRGYVLLLTRPDELPSYAGSFLTVYSGDIEEACFFGSDAAISQRARSQVMALLKD